MHLRALQIVEDPCRFSFRLIRVEITLDAGQFPDRAAGPDAVEPVRRTSVEDCESVQTIAATCYSHGFHGRFHGNPMIQSKVADSIKAEWALYFFKGAHQVLPYVSESSGNVYHLRRFSSPSDSQSLSPPWMDERAVEALHNG